MRASHVAEALGGTETFKSRIADAGALHARILKGIPYRAFEVLVDTFALARPLALEVLHVPSRTLARRKQSNRFPAEESDRLARLAYVASLAEDALGDKEKAGRWLQKRNRALGGAVPLEHLRTEAGTREVEAVLGRIEHGVFS